MSYYVEDHENGPLRANGSGGPPRTDKQPLLTIAAPLSHGSNPNSNAAGRRCEDDYNSARELAQPSTKRNGDPGVVQQGVSVRRLTPTECERLQGLDDGWTNPDSTAPDSRRYAGLGDAVTATVGHWLGARIRAADEVCA